MNRQTLVNEHTRHTDMTVGTHDVLLGVLTRESSEALDAVFDLVSFRIW